MSLFEWYVWRSFEIAEVWNFQNSWIFGQKFLSYDGCILPKELNQSTLEIWLCFVSSCMSQDEIQKSNQLGNLMKIRVLWDVMLCHWVSSLWLLKELLYCEVVWTSHSMAHYYITVDLNVQRRWCKNLRSFVDQWCWIAKMRKFILFKKCISCTF